MKFKHTLLLIIGFAFILSATDVFAQRTYSVFNCKTGKKHTLESLAIELNEEFDVVVFGEYHDDSLIHAIEAELLENLIAANKKVCVSMEMFERDVQPALNDYIAGKIQENEFLEKSRPWDNYDEAYKPIIELAKANKLHVIAANVPRKYASLYSTGGLGSINSLPPNERLYVAKSIKVKDDQYQKAFYKQMLDNMGMGDKDYTKMTYNQQNTLALYYGAQVVKDETMAESIYDYYSKNKKLIIHYNGDFHSRSRMGTVQKLMDRDKDLRVAVIAPSYVEKARVGKFNPEVKIFGNYMLLMEPKEKEQTFTQEMMGGHLGANLIDKHSIKLDLNPTTHNLKGKDDLKFKNPIVRKASVNLLKDLKIESVTTTDGKLTYEVKSVDSLTNELVITATEGELYKISVSYSGNIYHQPDARQFNQRHQNSNGMISDLAGEGIYLPSGSFYPYTPLDQAEFSVEVSFPEQLEVLTSGKLEKKPAENGKKTYIFTSEANYDNLTLVGGKYVIKDTTYDGKQFAVYTFEASPLAKTYLDACIDYYKTYTSLFGPYPYSSFIVVENFFATGFGMPNYTLLSNQLMKMPWVTLTPGALAHEFVHNWWGNSVFVNPDRENWCEALTTFSTNYYYNVITGNDQKAFEWRQAALVSLESLPDKLNYPLKSFKYQATDEDAIIGYQKGGFVFYELYKLMGKDNFFNALKGFASSYKGKKAIWFSLNFNLQQYVKKAGLNVPVNRVINQWINTPKIPAIKLGGVFMRGDSCFYTIDMDSTFYMMVPVRITTDKDTFWKDCLVTRFKPQFSIPRTNGVRSIEVDPMFQCLRKMYKWEIPTTYKQSQNANAIYILPSKKSADYAASLEYVNQLNKTGYKFTSISGDEVTDNAIAGKSLVIIGTALTNPFIAKLALTYPADFQIAKDQFAFKGKNYPLKGNMAMINYIPKGKDGIYYTLLYCDNMNNVEQFRRFSHYSSYSAIVIPQGRGGQPLLTGHIYPEKTTVNELQYRFLK